MKVKNGEIFSSKEALQKMLDVKFPVKISYELAKMVVKFSNQLEVIEKTRTTLLKKYGKEENGNLSIDPKSENWNAFVEEFNTLMTEEVEVEIEKIKISSSLPFDIDTKTLIVLDKFIEITT